MKAKLVILFVIYFFIASVGIVYGTHSCGNRDSNTIWGLSVSSEHACLCKHDSSSNHKSNCCKDSVKWVKSKTDASKHQFTLKLIKVELCNSHFLNLVKLSKLSFEEKAVYKVSHSPPLGKTPFFIRFRTLLI